MVDSFFPKFRIEIRNEHNRLHIVYENRLCIMQYKTACGDNGIQIAQSNYFKRQTDLM